ncbi:MaoC family dehydratase [Streptomyces longispororuber]|uniref:MaoC family dehydratase n=1 Tax=Streptomyces longispororuber TaxID=68230 RepID=UPI002108C7F4|nr:MaoC family dehydratase [Streptomyces longispororuber]MCQ4214122.1 MaoC family dehydratase [Streptomyces longispororuber]
MPKTFSSPAEFAAAAGTHVGVSDWVTVTQDRIDTFADATGDHQWIHVDPARAANGPFGAPIAHGYLTLSLIPVLTQGVYKIEDVRMGVNYGLNKVRFMNPVTVGSRVRASIDVVSADEVPGGGRQIVNRVTVEIEGADKPACVAETVVRVY